MSDEHGELREQLEAERQVRREESRELRRLLLGAELIRYKAYLAYPTEEPASLSVMSVMLITPTS